MVYLNYMDQLSLARDERTRGRGLGRVAVRVVLAMVSHVKLPVNSAEVVAVRSNHGEEQKHGCDLAQRA